MSSKATFTRLNRADLEGLVEAAEDEDPRAFLAYLAENGASVADFDDDGEIFSVLLPVLDEEYSIDLEVSENELVGDITELTSSLVFILTQAEKTEYLSQLDPESFDEEDLADAYEDFTEEDAEEETGALMRSAIAALHTALGEVDNDHVVVVAIT